MNSIELTNQRAVVQARGVDEPEEEGLTEHHLEPTDRGPAAWRLLCLTFIFESLFWGLLLSFGVFQDYYSQQPQFADNRYIAVVGTVASSISYLGAPFITPFIKRYQRFQHKMIWCGWLICISGVALASFCDTVKTLILTQGVAYGIGFLIFYFPILSMVNEYWIARRGMAYGLLCSSSGASGAFMPFVIQELLDRYGYRTTLRALAMALFVLTGPLIPFLRGRLPLSSQTALARPDWGFLRNTLFWIYSVSNIAQGLGYFFPSLFLPSYVTSLGLSSKYGGLLLALMNISQVLGQLTFGSLSDRNLPLSVLTAVSLATAGTAALALWGLATSLPLLIVFALVYGFFAAGYTAMWARMTTAVTSDPLTVPFVFGLFNFGKGIGNVLAGPISSNLLFSATSAESYGLAKYMPLIVFTGCSMIFGSLTMGLRHARISHWIG
ncbi:hypothetical protein QQS21_011127 [Conoideocrella luteorostrata]|uniref:Major facilitator superfamily (MFS) profile domain-containing protein n=1 Tax=Conoideocrella luteorostrata TaxID=1105319 RepID=A0AAJ0FU14_9HYPO|nr:hypothetical protein QQS21_011127 [Conoideocrella luteorostrata]